MKAIKTTIHMEGKINKNIASIASKIFYISSPFLLLPNLNTLFRKMILRWLTITTHHNNKGNQAYTSDKH